MAESRIWENKYRTEAYEYSIKDRAKGPHGGTPKTGLVEMGQKVYILERIEQSSLIESEVRS